MLYEIDDLPCTVCRNLEDAVMLAIAATYNARALDRTARTEATIRALSEAIQIERTALLALRAHIDAHAANDSLQ